VKSTPAEIVAQKLAWEVETRTSIELRVAAPIISSVADQAKPKLLDSYEEHYIETAAGQRFCEFQGFLADKLTTREQHYGDGSKFADVTFDPRNLDRQQVVFIKRQFYMESRNDRRQIPPPLLFLYVGRTPLHKALPNGEYLGTDKVLGRECDLFLFPKVRWPVVQDQVFYLDRETAIPLKFVTYRNQEARERKQPAGEWVAESLDKVQGHFIPLKSTLTSKRPDGSNGTVWRYTVKSVAFDKDYPASTFWPTRQPGVIVHDEFTGKTKSPPGKEKTDKASTAPGQEKTKSKAQPKATTSTSSVQIQAVSPRNWTAALSSGSLGLGSAVLLTGILLWWRRA
jgi:hypothetical protein